MSVVALSMSKVMWLVKGARNYVVVAAKARPWIPMHHLPNPYFESFEEVVDIIRFDLNKHWTAGLCLTTTGGRLFLGSISPSTPAAKIPRWCTRIKGAWLIRVGLTVVTTIKKHKMHLNRKLPPVLALSCSYSYTPKYD